MNGYNIKCDIRILDNIIVPNMQKDFHCPLPCNVIASNQSGRAHVWVGR